MTERVRITGGFTAIPNAILRSVDLSLEAKGMLALIASHAGNWEFRRDDMLKKSACSKNKYYRIINVLKASGCLEIVPLDAANGRFSGSEWVLHFEPRPQMSDKEPCPQIGDLPCPQKPDTEKGDHKNTNTRIPKEESVAAPQNLEDFIEDFLEAHPRPKNQDETAEAFKALVEGGADPDDLVRAANLYADEQRGNAMRFVAGSDAWLKKNRHLDYLRKSVPKADPEAINAGIASTIKKGKPFLCTNITDQKAAELVAAGLVSASECAAVGLRP